MVLPLIVGGALIGTLVWNVLTDPVWIGNTLGFLPKDDIDGVQKQSLTILNLINSARNVAYSATKNKRNLSQQEKELIRNIADTAEKQINDMVNVYWKKINLYGRKDVVRQLEISANTLKLELQAMKQTAGLIPREAVKTNTITAKVAEVFDGDTVQLENKEIVRLVGIDAPESTTRAGEKSKEYLQKKLTGQMVKVESDPDALIDMYGRRLGVIYLNNENINIDMLKKGLADFDDFEPNALVFKKQWKAAADEAKPTAITLPKVQIFTGVITRGRLGSDTPFLARPDDLIDSTQDLQTAAENNLSSFLATLPNKITYEIKIVSSIITKDGYRQRGTSQQIVSGYKKDGTPKYKTVLNKFAIIDIYVFTARDTRTKIQQVILGPVDAVLFQPKIEEIKKVEKNIKESIVTSDVTKIETLITPTPPIVQAPQPISPPVPTGTITPTAVMPPSVPSVTAPVPTPAPPPVVTPPPAPTITPTITPAPAGIPWTSNNPNRCNVSTISEFFDTAKMKYPLLAERAPYYEQWGLGSKAYYTGTAEQNNKFLAEVKRRSGC